MMNIYVGNASYNVSEGDLKELFEQYGPVNSVKIVKDKFTGKSKGFAFVEMPSRDLGQQAINALDGKEFQGRTLKVNEARPREERPSRPQRY
jgi:RNA recognition motif-containing protein